MRVMLLVLEVVAPHVVSTNGNITAVIVMVHVVIANVVHVDKQVRI